MPHNSDPPPNEKRFVRRILLISVLETFVFGAIFGVTYLLYGDPFAIQKAWPLWVGGLAPVYIAIILSIKQLKTKD